MKFTANCTGNEFCSFKTEGETADMAEARHIADKRHKESFGLIVEEGRTTVLLTDCALQVNPS